MGSVWNGVARQASGFRFYFLSRVGVGTGDGGLWAGGVGFFFVMVRLLLLYILINKWGLNSLREYNKKRGGVGRRGFLCELFIKRKKKKETY